MYIKKEDRGYLRHALMIAIIRLESLNEGSKDKKQIKTRRSRIKKFKELQTKLIDW